MPASPRPARFPPIFTAFVICLATHGGVFSRAVAAPRGDDSAPQPGTILWKHEIGAQIWGPLTLRDGKLYFGCDDGRVVAFDLETRQPQWAFQSPGRVRSAVVIAAGKAILSSDDGFLHALDASTGEPLWRFDLGMGRRIRILPALGPPFEYDYRQSSPAVLDGTVYVGSMNKHFYAIDLETGTERWHFECQGKVRATPVVEGATVYFGSWDGSLYALDRDTGALRWQFDTGGIVQGNVALSDGKVVVGSRSAKVFALSAATGEVLWTFSHADGSWVESTPVIEGDVIYVGSSDARKVFAFDLATGKTRWDHDTGGWAWSTPVLAGDVLYIGSLSASPYYITGVTLHAGLHAIDKKTGTPLWSVVPASIQGYITGGFYSTPVVVDRALIGAGLDGWLYALQR